MTERTTIAESLPCASAAGRLIAGKFLLQSLIGEGGQAFIWKAKHVELDSVVALKILRWSCADATQTERLRKEARAVARLDHPAIVRVFDLGQTAEGNPYFVMEHLDGENLADALSKMGKMTPVDAVRLLLPIASGVAAVHDVGVVHRDLKPDNVFLANGAHGLQPKLLDFGVAKHDMREGRQMKLTEVGAVLGSPFYLSPEQARGQANVDERSDIWSFCVMLYECVTGAVPFRAANTHALLFSIAEDPPPSLMDHGISEPELWDIIRRGLEKTPNDRWPDMRLLGRELAEWLLLRDVHSDVTGLVLDAAWFAPDVAAPAPYSSKRRKSPASESPPPWTRQSDVSSQVGTRSSSRLLQLVPKEQHKAAGIALIGLAALLGVALVWFASGRRSSSDNSSLVASGKSGATWAMLWRPLDLAQHRDSLERRLRAARSLLSVAPGARLPMAAVPVEELRLVKPEPPAQLPPPIPASSSGGQSHGSNDHTAAQAPALRTERVMPAQIEL